MGEDNGQPQRFRGWVQDTAMREQWERLHLDRHEAERRERESKEMNMSQRLDSMNEWRREEIEDKAQFAQASDVVRLERDLSLLQGRDHGLAIAWGVAGTILGILAGSGIGIYLAKGL